MIVSLGLNGVRHHITHANALGTNRVVEKILLNILYLMFKISTPFRQCSKLFLQLRQCHLFSRETVDELLTCVNLGIMSDHELGTFAYSLLFEPFIEHSRVT